MNFKYEVENVAVHHNSLMILVGPSGSGKSTFVGKNFSESMRVSTDECRRMICGSHLNQRVSEDAFDIFYTIIEKRLKNGNPTVADSTALKRKYRQRLVKIAQKYKFKTVLILFDLPLHICMNQDKKRKQYAVGEKVIEQQYKNLQKTKMQIHEEKYDQVIIFNSSQQARSMHFRFTHPDVEKKDLGPFDIISSINGCYDELQVLLRKLGYQQNGKSEYYHPERRKLVVLGDICNKGPCNAETLQLIYNMWQNNCAYYVPGDECEKLYNFLKGDRVIKSRSLQSTQCELEDLSQQQICEFTTQFKELYERSSPYLILADGNLVVSHGGILGKWIGQLNKKIKSFCMHGDVKRSPWYKNYHGKAHIVYGHPHTKVAHWKNRTMNINLDVACGGQLCALRYPEKNVVTVNANKNYYKTKN
ncbi:AAA family ATPase [Candidatus Uabimicrobium amorphum]|uniref:Polynucleotide kinase-phosphatase n=1 Tax=Uabimicrobium amorphum TaxID=2596890 RepID=A0A5S9F1Y4_UABAM|nr:AAA family ATPase [Candidatus Uabimicrobium amorphum]BBM82681.1 polynucleotide kinase-phosphatase [Candidatus Uabimicrobium amorphum]